MSCSSTCRDYALLPLATQEPVPLKNEAHVLPVKLCEKVSLRNCLRPVCDEGLAEGIVLMDGATCEEDNLPVKEITSNFVQGGHVYFYFALEDK